MRININSLSEWSWRLQSHSQTFDIADNKYYETADHYYNKEKLITNEIGTLINAHNDNKFVGPLGGVQAFNNTIALGEGSHITLGYIPVTECIIDPSNCAAGITVSLWTRNNLFLSEDDEDTIFILSWV